MTKTTTTATLLLYIAVIRAVLEFYASPFVVRFPVSVTSPTSSRHLYYLYRLRSTTSYSRETHVQKSTNPL